MNQFTDTGNEIAFIAERFILETSQSVFLTGKAGTGKTTFLKKIREKCPKNMVVVAPTGVAAINAGGTTIHSFFQLPFAPFIPVGRNPKQSLDLSKSFVSKLRFSTERKEIMRKLELLVIDEISMVRCDLLDAIDTVLRYIRRNPLKPFGGVQVLYIGDLYQLAPVVKQDEWRLLNRYYQHPYFFASEVIQEQAPVYIELQKVFRQQDNAFIELLNKVRNNQTDGESFYLLESRYQPQFETMEADFHITLTTHNLGAQQINSQSLAKLNSKEHVFRAIIEGVFPESSFPAEEQLLLKEGARIMFIKNDAEKIRRYYNGKTGIVQLISNDQIMVDCDGELIEVKRETWNNIRYSLNERNRQLEEEILGSFSQYPLRLAWAITIHKSQGLTFDKIIVDAGKAFTAGQVYVALSRCTSFNGLILKSRLSMHNLYSDDNIVQYVSAQKKLPSVDKLFDARKNYQQEIIREHFDFTAFGKMANALIYWNRENHYFSSQTDFWVDEIATIMKNLLRHGNTFCDSIEQYHLPGILPEENAALADRTRKAASWFKEELTKIIGYLNQSPALTDNRQYAFEYAEKMYQLISELHFRNYLLGIYEDGFSAAALYERKQAYKKPDIVIKAYSGSTDKIPAGILYPDLYLSLKNMRDQLAHEKNTPVFMVCSSESLEQMVQLLPQDKNQLLLISGMGSSRIAQFGNKFIEIIQHYCAEHELNPSSISASVKTKKKKTTKPQKDTKQETLTLYKSGLNIPQIASSRNLSVSTIETHLATFIEKGELLIENLVEPAVLEQIQKAMAESQSGKLLEIKQSLPDEIGYGMIKWVMADQKFKLSNPVV